MSDYFREKETEVVKYCVYLPERERDKRVYKCHKVCLSWSVKDLINNAVNEVWPP